MSQQQQQEMSFAQALTEARQIIVQQSNRIKTDLEKIKALQQTIATQTSSINSNERTIREQADVVRKHEDHARSLTTKLNEATQAREQAETIIDRQGQRLTHSQASIESLERQLAEQAARVEQLADELDSLRGQLPTQQDTDALAALSTLLTTKKVSVPAAGRPERPAQPMRIAEAA